MAKGEQVLVEIPVLEDMNGYFLISMYVAGSDGNFKRTGKRPFRILSGIINGVSAPLGTIETNPRMRRSLINWKSPSVIEYSQRRPNSVYHFFRENIAARKYYIATCQHGVSRSKTLNLHLIEFRPGISPGIKKLFADKCIDAMQLWGVSKKTD